MQLVHFDLNRELITIVHGISVLELIRCIATEESYHPRHLAAEPANPCVETKVDHCSLSNLISNRA
ncbi:hypothetical protein BDA96_09G071000 [Sorghum bicolor]|uniref:Uncharacterized protein n=1 Tax=Sorghum bicolor TaxID=4558 RepID=A0A921QB28_SORBI|nr:hypothetical protein BDA96_09G071000 [Sorghum bicolor]